MDSGRVYTLSREGHLFCLTADKGKVVWKKNLEKAYGLKSTNFGVVFSPMVDGDNLIVMMGAYSGAVIAFNKADGREIWKWKGYGQSYASPVIMTQGERKMVLVFSSGGLDALSFGEVGALRPAGFVLHAVKCSTAMGLSKGLCR